MVYEGKDNALEHGKKEILRSLEWPGNRHF